MFILAALIVVLAVWVLVRPSWAPPPPSTRRLSARANQVGESAANTGRRVYSGVRGRLKLRSDKKELAQRFRLWASESAMSDRAHLTESLPSFSESFTAWLGRLPDKQAVDFSQEVAHFCAEQNFDIAWLNDPQVNSDAPLKQAVEDAVLLYGLAWWRANQVQYDVQALLKLKAFLANPARREHKAFGQQLFSALADEGLVQMSPALVTAGEKERLAYMTSAIQQASLQHPNQFSIVLHRTVNGSQVAPSTITTSMTEAPPAPSASDIKTGRRSSRPAPGAAT